jgi:hypothetical protein
MMPPHLRGAPTLAGDTLVLEGYSLNYTDPASELTVVDVATGEALAFDATLEETREDRSGGAMNPPPGAIQFRCTLTVRLQGVQPGHTYRVRYVDEAFEITAP